MCGIVGIFSFRENIGVQTTKKMADALRHRGPDDEGLLAVGSKTGGVYPLVGVDSKVTGPGIEQLGEPVRLFLHHRRLSIIDLSPTGHQPMGNEDGTLWIVYNGEVYNYIEVRRELETRGHRFRSQGDTEVILHAYEEWGTDCLSHFNGMWAFCIWDSRKKQLFGARDRAGVKPFYYFFDGETFAFASEIKALLTLEHLSPVPNEQVIADYLFFGIVDHSQETFFKNIYQLRAGQSFIVKEKQLSVISYWDINPKEVFFKRPEEYAERFYELLEDSIRLRLRSDVPMGTCLSGGLDSSSVVCLANRLILDGESVDPKLVGERQKTFSSCFQDPVYDERSYIEKVIRHTGAEKNYVFPQAEPLLKEWAQLIWHQDEPFISTSIYAQWNVMKLARNRGVVVLLDGQGGDELLAGYLPSFYVRFVDLLEKGRLGHLSRELKGFRKRHPTSPSHFLNSLGAAFLPPSAKQWIWTNFGKKADWLDKGFQKKYLRVFPKPKKFEDDLTNYLYQGFRSTSLPGLLHYEDRNSMAFSLETRLPFLDYRLVEYVFSLPPEQKLKEGVTKVVLRNAMKGILPEEVRNRQDKMGFVTPEDIWFRTILKDPIERIINSKSFSERGYFNGDAVSKAFQQHCEGKKNISSIIWRWVNLELWFRTFVDGKPFLEA